MAKKITITLCAIVIGFSTIFINNNIVKADETTINESIKFIQNCDVVYYNGSQFTGYVNYELKTNYIDFYGIENFSNYTGKWDALKLISKDVETTKYKLNLEKLYLTNYIEGLRVTIVSKGKSYYYIIKDNKFISQDKEPIYNFDKFTSISFFNNGSNMVRDMRHFTIYDENGYYINLGYIKGLNEGYNKGIQQALDTFNSAYYLNKYFFNSNSEATGKVYETKYTNPNDTLLGTFNLGVSESSGLTFINAKEYYKDYTPQSYNYIEIHTVNEEFTYGYNQLIFNGLPIGTLIHLELKFIAKNEYTDISYAIDSNGKLHYLHGGQQGYVPNTCLNSIRINGFIGYNFETGKEYKPLEDATFFNFKDYANFSVTLPKDFTNKSLYEKGYNQAKNEYYNKWYLGRYQQGYNDGTSNASNYTFLSLVGAIIDAPIQSISKMLNFDLLGFNMSQFFFALLTVCIIVTIVKLLL